MSWFGGKKKQKQKQYTGFPGDCSQEQLQILGKFKNHVQSNKLVSVQQFDDTYLLRFLRARKFDLPKTTKMWNQFVQWRLKNNIENYKNLKFPKLPQLRKMYPHGYHKVDKQFRPVYIERVGFMDVDKVFKVMQTEQLIQYYAVLYQTLLTTIFDGCTQAKIMATGDHNKVTQTVTILDLKHVKLGNAGKAYDFVKPVSAMAQNNYPEILGNMFIVNAPMLFTGIWQIVKVWIDDKTKQKIKILGGSYKKQLLQFIDPQNLPAFLDGGKCTCGGKQCLLEANVGPWNPEGKQLFENNINMQIKPQFNAHKGFHKEQVLLSSPDVLVEVEVKDQIPAILSHQNADCTKEDEVLQKVKQLDLNQKYDKQVETIEQGTETQQQKLEQKVTIQNVEKKQEAQQVKQQVKNAQNPAVQNNLASDQIPIKNLDIVTQ